jgi:site-specific recombinase XerD
MPATSDDQILSKFEESLTQTALSPATIVNYLSDLRAFCRWGAGQKTGVSLLQANQEHIRRYRHHLAKELGRAASTVNRHLMSLRKFYAFAADLGLLDLDPVAGVALVHHTSQPDSAPLTEAEVERLLTAANHSPRAGLARRDVAILQLILCTGLRISEIVDLQKSDLVFDHPGLHLRVCSGHSQKERHLPLSGEMVKILSDYLQVRPQLGNGNLFLNQEGRAISSRTVQRIISQSAKAANLPGVSAQQLRRTFAVQLLAKTQDLALVSKRLGHQHISITEQYLSNNL